MLERSSGAGQQLQASSRARAVWTAAILLAVALVGSAAVVVIVEGGTSFFLARAMEGLPAVWTAVLGAIGGLGCLALAIHSIRGLRTGRLRISQAGVGSVVVDPWSRVAALETSVAIRNSDRSTPLQPASIEIVRYSLDGVQHHRRIVGRVVARSTRPVLVEPKSEGEASVRFSVPMVTSAAVVAADVVLRDEYYRKARAHLSFEASRLPPSSAPPRRRWRSA